MIGSMISIPKRLRGMLAEQLPDRHRQDHVISGLT